MKRMGFWVTVTLVNLCLLAFAGALLRTKFLFPMPWLDYRNLLSAHSHFAFGGWATLGLMLLMVAKLLDPERRARPVYQYLFASIQLTSLGMYFSFPFQGYAAISIFFSTTYILTTYVFCWVFIRDLWKSRVERSVRLLSLCGLLSLAISSVGPFALAWMMATGSGTVFQQRDAVYTFLHFQYNGFFTLAILALFFHGKYREASQRTLRKIRAFSILICASVIPSLFLSLLWHATNQSLLRPLAYLGCLMVVLSVAGFVSLVPGISRHLKAGSRMARLLLIFALVSFFIKMVLQTGTVFPELGNAVFGFRPVIIGYLHLIFLGMLSFYILSAYIEDGFLPVNRGFARFAVIYFSAMIIIHELILLVNGVELLRGRPHPAYGWLVWYAALGLLTGAALLVGARGRLRVGSG